MPEPIVQMFGTARSEDGTGVDVMLCIDEDFPTIATVHAYKWDAQKKLPVGTAVRIEATSDLTQRGTKRIRWRPIATHEITEVGSLNLGAVQPINMHADLCRCDTSLIGSWCGPENIEGSLELHEVEKLTVEPKQCESWNDFKSWAVGSRQKEGAAFFRGHGNNQYRLSTTLARVGRTRLERFMGETMPRFRAQAEAILGRRLDANNPEENATVLALAQHHGLPTPLMDWTHSPYIAAFFAFADAVERQDVTQVRIYALSQDWVRFGAPVVNIAYLSPYTNSFQVGPFLNPRLQAQQGAFLVTNVVDVESQLLAAGIRDQRSYLVAADVPIEMAHEALQDLAYMGLTASTMFPGIDGLCRTLRYEMLPRKFRKGKSS